MRLTYVLNYAQYLKATCNPVIWQRVWQGRRLWQRFDGALDLILKHSLTTRCAELTGSGSSLLPVQQSNCNISTGGQAYDIALAESEFFRSKTYTSYVSAYIFGVAPVLTVFYPNNAPNSTLSLGQAKAHLTCLKIVEPGASDSYPGLLNAASSFCKPSA
jgi:hypothetical protein